VRVSICPLFDAYGKNRNDIFKCEKMACNGVAKQKKLSDTVSGYGRLYGLL